MTDAAPPTEQTEAEVWEQEIRELSEHLRQTTECEAVLIVCFAPPWMDPTGASPCCSMGLAGTQGMNILRLVSDIRELARVLEQQAAKMAAGVAFEVEGPRDPGGLPV